MPCRVLNFRCARFISAASSALRNPAFRWSRAKRPSRSSTNRPLGYLSFSALAFVWFRMGRVFRTENLMRFAGILVLAGACGLSISAQSKAAADASDCVVVSEGAPSLPAQLLEGQGKISFPITTNSAEARRFFEQGVAQMHSFWAREAERSFLQAAALDPAAPMPWWGVAMVASGDFRPHFQL